MSLEHAPGNPQAVERYEAEAMRCHACTRLAREARERRRDLERSNLPPDDLDGLMFAAFLAPAPGRGLPAGE
jgi:hypothetical protein